MLSTSICHTRACTCICTSTAYVPIRIRIRIRIRIPACVRCSCLLFSKWVQFLQQLFHLHGHRALGRMHQLDHCFEARGVPALATHVKLEEHERVHRCVPAKCVKHVHDGASTERVRISRHHSVERPFDHFRLAVELRRGQGRSAGTGHEGPFHFRVAIVGVAEKHVGTRIVEQDDFDSDLGLGCGVVRVRENLVLDAVAAPEPGLRLGISRSGVVVWSSTCNSLWVVESVRSWLPLSFCFK